MRKTLISLSMLLCTVFSAFADNYTPVEYISADGIARENAMTSDYKPVTATTIKIGFVSSAGNGWTAIFCGRNKGAGTGISLYKNGNDVNFGYFAGGMTGDGDGFAPFAADTRYDVEANVAYLKWSTDGGANWETKETGQTVTNETSRCLSLFANPENDQSMKGRIYYLTITEGETTYEYKPVMRHDGMLGFLDAKSGKFFTAAKNSMSGYGYAVASAETFYFTGIANVEVGVSASAKIAPKYLGTAPVFTYKSADESIATVAADGTVTGVKEGETTITVTAADEAYGEWTKTCKVKVANHTPVEYISSDGVARENAMTSTYIPVTSTTINIGFTASATNSWTAIFCGRNYGAGTGISLYKNGNDSNFGYFTGGTTGAGDTFAPFTADTRYDAIANVGYLKLSTDGGANYTEYPTGNTVTNATTRCLSLFANPENDNALKGRIYYLTITDDENTYNYKPVMRHDGTLGFYDATNGLFFTAAQGSMMGYGYAPATDETFYLTGLDKTTIEIGEAATAKITPTYVGTAPEFTYTSADEGVATVAADGTVTGVKEGKTTITVTATDATYGTWTQTCTVEVVDQSKLSYTPLEYIESTGAAKENAYTTKYIPNEKTVVDIKFNSYSVGEWRAIFSGRNGSDAGTGISLYQNGDGKHFGYFVGGYRNDNFVADVLTNHDYEVSASLAGLVVDGTTYNTDWTSFNGTTRGISMFGNPEWDNAYRGRIYYMTIKEGDNVVREYKPVLRHDGVFGYLDKLTGEFVQPAQGKFDGYGYAKTATDTYVEVVAENMFVGGTTEAGIVVTNGNKDDYTVTYTSETPEIVTVNGNTLTGVAEGNGTITAVVVNKNDATDVWKITKTVKVMVPTRNDINGVGYAAIEGGAGYSDNETWTKLCDAKTDTKYCGQSANAWVTIQASEPVAMSTYSIVTGGDTGEFPARNPLSWKISGSNDNQNWTVLDTKTEDYSSLQALNAQEFIFTVNDETKYRYFKYESVKGMSDCIQISEIWINEQKHEYGEPTVTASTCATMGTSVETCALTGAKKTTRLPLEAHAYVDGICSVCGQSALTKVLLADGQTNPYTAKYQHAWRISENNWPAASDENWNKADFDDSAWGEITMPVGTYGVMRTYWNNEYNNFWFRRTFNLDAVDEGATFSFKILHDDNYTLYVNGNEIKSEQGWTDGTGWNEYTIDASNFQKGENVVAVYIQQNFGGAYFDCSLTEYIPVIISDNADNTITAGKGTVKLTRSFNDGTWNSMVLPFAMDAAKITDVFGADAKVAEYTGTTANENGTVTLNFSTVTEIKANVPVLISGATAVENKELTDIAVVEATPIAEPASAAYTFVGTYVQATAQAGEWLINADNTLLQAEGTEAVKPTSAIFHSVDGAEVKGLSISIDGDVVIDNIDLATMTEDKGDVYNLNGVKLNGKNMPKGIYIVGGKKLVVK